MSDRFQTRDPALPIIPLDMGRLSIMLSCIDAPHLKESGCLRDFISNLHAASGGDVAVLPLLIDCFDQWPGFGSKKQNAELTALWTAVSCEAPASDAAVRLKTYCSTQPLPLPESMVQTLFDDPSFDAIAYLDWHNSPD